MGNRAIITGKGSNLGIYLHWNGGMDSVQGFLKYAAEIAPHSGMGAEHQDSGLLVLTTIITNFFGNDGSTISLMHVDPAHLDGDGLDNGVYVVNGWEIVERVDAPGTEQNAYKLLDMMLSIDDAQPEQGRIRDMITAERVSSMEVQVGDIVVVRGYGGKVEKHTVVGFGEDRVINGYNVLGMPLTDAYTEDNINAYIRSEEVLVSR